MKQIKELPFTDSTIKWFVRTSLNHLKIITGDVPDTGSIQYTCDDATCIPRYYGGFLSWYNPSTENVGNRMFDLQEAWDHEKRENPNVNYPYNGKVGFVPGYGGFFLAVHLTDGSNIIQVNIIRRYIDNTILIYNTGKYGTTSYDINVTVYDPPSALGYNKTTNGTIIEGGTVLAPGQYVLFYKDITAPAVDETTGLFQTSPFGVNKSQPHEIWINSFSKDNINIPKMYLGIKAPKDMEVISNGCYIGACMHAAPSGSSDLEFYPLYRSSGQQKEGIYNVSHIGCSFEPTTSVPKGDPVILSWFTGRMTDGFLSVVIWFGWGEDGSGNVKFILLSKFIITVGADFKELFRIYEAYIYDKDRDEAYFTSIIKVIKDVKKRDKVWFSSIVDYNSGPPAYASAYINYTDTWNKITTAGTDEYTSAYGFCNFYDDRINCAEGLAIYTTSGIILPAPKMAFAASRYGGVGAHFVKDAWMGLSLYAENIYATVVRLKTFPATTTDDELQYWFKSLQPKVLTTDEFNGLLGVLPWSLWLFGEIMNEVKIITPQFVKPGSQFTVDVVCTTRPNTNVWVIIIDKNGNIISSGSNTTDANGNASITLTAPNSVGDYEIWAIVQGDRSLI